eukprot:scaffold75850_cov27-Tisochrysis_lutea.AAC.1
MRLGRGSYSRTWVSSGTRLEVGPRAGGSHDGGHCVGSLDRHGRLLDNDFWRVILHRVAHSSNLARRQFPVRKICRLACACKDKGWTGGSLKVPEGRGGGDGTAAGGDELARLHTDATLLGGRWH